MHWRKYNYSSLPYHKEYYGDSNHPMVAGMFQNRHNIYHLLTFLLINVCLQNSQTIGVTS